MTDALSIAKARAQAAQENRKRMPAVTEILDEVRKDFPEARIRYATENGVTVGGQSDAVVVSDPGPTPVAVKEKPKRELKSRQWWNEEAA